MASYYVDPVEGVDGELPRGTARNLPWKTVRWASEKIRQAHPVSQAGVELNLRAGVLHPFSVFDKLKGTAGKRLVIQPYGGDTITFDGSEPALREPGAWTAAPWSCQRVGVGRVHHRQGRPDRAGPDDRHPSTLDRLFRAGGPAGDQRVVRRDAAERSAARVRSRA